MSFLRFQGNGGSHVSHTLRVDVEELLLRIRATGVLLTVESPPNGKLF